MVDGGPFQKVRLTKRTELKEENSWYQRGKPRVAALSPNIGDTKEA